MADDAMAAATSSAPDAGSGDASGAGGSNVLCTIMQNADGTFQLIQGDEPEPGETPDAGDAASQGQSYDSPGPLLKDLLGILNDAQSSGEGSADDNFQKGFSGDTTPTPAAGKSASSPGAMY